MPSSPRSSSDSELLHRALSGDIEALGSLIERHFGKAYAVALARLRDPEAAADLAQEVFIRVQLNLHQLGPQGNFPAWVVRIARNLAIDWQRRGLRASRLLPMVPMEGMIVDPPEPSDKGARETMARDEESQALHRAIESLSPEQREVLLLHHMEDLSQREIAEQLGVNPSTVSRLLGTARKALRRHLEPVLGEAIARSRPPRSAVVRSLLIASALGAMSASAKATLAASATVGQWTSAAETVKAGAAGAVGVIGFLKSLPALIAGGGQVMATGKGIAAAVVAVTVIAGGGIYHASKGAERESGAAAVSSDQDILSLYPYRFTETLHLEDGSERSVHTLFLSPGRIRSESDPWISIWDAQNHPGEYLMLDPRRRLAILNSFADVPAYPSDVLQRLDELTSSAQDWHTTERDPQTGLLSRVETTYPDGQGSHVMSDFEYRCDLAESLFSMEPPEGYQLVEAGTLERVPTEQRLIEGLRASTALTGGVFPPDFSMDWLVSWAEDLQPRIPQLSEEEIAQIRDAEPPVRRGIRFAEYVGMQGGEFHWEGAGVPLGDADAVVCWWTFPDSTTRRVVLGDLTVRDEETEDEVAQIEPGSPEYHCHSLFDSLMTGDWNQAQSLFFTEEQLREFARRIGQPIMPQPQLEEMLAEQRRLFRETSDALRAAQSVTYIGPRGMRRGGVSIPDGFDQREDVFINILVDGQRRQLFFNVMLQMDDHWYIMDGPTLR